MRTLPSRIARSLVSVLLLAGLAGCEAQSPPEAIIAIGAGPFSTGIPVVLDGAGSVDPDGDALRFEWRLAARPAGSAATLVLADTATPRFTPDALGDYAVKLVVHDGTQPSVADEAVIEVRCQPAAPVVSAEGPAEAPVGRAVRLRSMPSSVAQGDGCPEGSIPTVAWRWIQRPPGSTADFDAHTALAPQFVPDVAGRYEAEVAARTLDGVSATARVAVQVACGDAAPVVHLAATPAAPAVGEATRLQATAHDPDQEGCGLAQPLTYAWRLLSRPPSSTSVLVGHDRPVAGFTPDLPGTYTFAVAVADPDGHTTTETLAFVVGDCGSRPPIFASLTATPAEATSGVPVALQAQVIDPDQDACGAAAPTVEWAVIAQPAGATAAIRPAQGVHAWLDAAGAGTYMVEATATDATGLTVTQQVQINVSRCGSGAPQVALLAEPAAPSAGGWVTLTAAVDDPDTAPPCERAEAHALDWRFVRFPAGFEPPMLPAGPVVAFLPGVPGEYLIEAQATDAAGHQGAAGQITLAVGLCGAQAPVIEGLDVPAVALGVAAQLTARVLDADAAPPCAGADAPTWAWRLSERPAGSQAQLIGAHLAAPSFTADVPGRYAVALQISDATGRSDHAETRFTVDPCGDAAPVVVARVEPAAPVVGTITRLSASIEDADTACGAVEHFDVRWTLIDAPPGFDAARARLALAAPWFEATVPGLHTFRVTVMDRAGHVGEAEVVVPVADCGGTAPTVAAIAAAPLASSVGEPVRVSAEAADADAACGADAALMWRWRILARPLGSEAVFDDASRPSPSFTPDQAGDYRVSARVVDATGRVSDAVQRVITVQPCGDQPPVLEPVAVEPAQPVVGARVVLRGAGEDPDAACAPAGALRWTWRFVALPRGSQAELVANNTNQPWFSPDLSGHYAGVGTATDTSGQTAQVQFALDVDACGGHAPALDGLSLFPDAVDLHRALALTVTVTDADVACPAGGDASVQWRLTGRPAGSVATIDAPAALSPSITPDLPGAYVLEVVAIDDIGLRSTPGVVRFTAGVCNDQSPVALLEKTAPAPAAGPVDVFEAEVFACAGADFLQLDARASFDPDNAAACGAEQALFYEWQVLEGVAGGQLAIRDADRRNPTFSVDRGGRYVVGLNVTDDTGRRSSRAQAILDVVEVPAPRVDGAAPDFVCAREVVVTVTGEGFLEYDGAPPHILVNNTPLPIDALAGCQLVQADPPVRSCTRATFTLPADFDPDVYSVRVQNPFPVGCASTQGAQLVVAGSPAIDVVEPEPICRGQFEGDLTLRGSGFFRTVGGLLPIVRVNNLASVVREMNDCVPLGAGVEVCRGMRFSVPDSQRDAEVLAITLTNPPPADCEVARFELRQSEPPRIDDIQPRKICDLGGTLDLTGAFFEPGMRVQLGLDPADAVVPNLAGTFAQASWIRGDAPRLTPGLHVVRATNPTGCFDEFEEEIRVTEGPFVFFADPPVVYNGVTLQASVYLGNLYGGSITRAVITDQAAQETDLVFTFNPLTPNRIQAVIPAGLPAGVYDITIYDDVDCPGTAEGLITVTDRLTVAVGTVTPRFGWTARATAITLHADPDRGFQPTPRAYLNPSVANECAAANDCNADEGCARGRCVSVCEGPGDCGVGEACLANLCQPQASELRAVVTPAPDTLQAIVGEGRRPGTYDLIVVNPDGSVGLAEAAFIITALPPPVIEAVSPGSWETNEIAWPVAIEGSDFRNSTVVATCRDRNGALSEPPLAVQQVQPTRITVTVNTSALAELTVCVVRVTNDDGAFADFAPVTITNPAGNFVAFSPVGALRFTRRWPAVIPGAPSRSARFLYAFGGDAGDVAEGRSDGERAQVDLFGQLGPWTPMRAPLPTGIGGARGVRVADFLYIVGGVDGQTGAASDAVRRALVLDPLDVPTINNLDFEFDLEQQRVPTGTYVYRVAAVMADDDAGNPGGETLASDPQPVFVPDIDPGVTVVIEWTAHPGAQAYRIYRSTLAGLALGNEALLAEVPANVRILRDDGGVVPAGRTPVPTGALGTWHTIAQLDVARFYHGVVAAPVPGSDGDMVGLYALGGQRDDGTTLGDVEAFAIDLNGPRDQVVRPLGRVAGALRNPRTRLDAVAVTAATASVLPAERSVIYALGGDLGGRFGRGTERADVLPDGRLSAWTPVTNMQRARAGYAAAVANNTIVTVGGQNGAPSGSADKGPLCGIDCADPADLGNWSALGNTGDNVAAVDYGRVAFAGFLYLVGGRDAGGATSRVEQSILGGTP